MSQSSFHQSIAAVAQAPGQFLQSAKANGLIKRNSIFSRPETRNGSVDLDASDLDSVRTTNRSLPTCQAARPSTSSGVMERSHTDPTLSKRHWLFRSRKKSLRKSVHDEDISGSEMPPRSFRSEDEYHSHLRKQSISPPFNFQHLSHTRRKHVPDLATVDEKDLSRVKIQAQQQSPSSDLQGIRANNLPTKLDEPRFSVSSRPTTPCLPEPGSGPHHSSSRSLDVRHIMQPAVSGSGRPRASSCQTHSAIQRNPSAVSRVVRLSTHNPNVPESESKPPLDVQVMHCSPSEVKYRSQQPLPALPQRAGSKRQSKRMTLDSQNSIGSYSETASSMNSPKSSTSNRVNGGSFNGRDEWGSTADISEASWENDVDFCYEQEAESTCDFHWDEHDEDTDDGFRLSRFLPPNDGSRTSALFAAAPQNTSPLQRRRSSIVGHRGFQHARTNSVNFEARYNDGHAQASQEHLASVSEDVEEPKPMFGPEVMHLGASVGSLSDAASTRTGSSGHQKSNSCASYESGIRPMAPSSDNGHSSVASLNSIPELIHSNAACGSSDVVAAMQDPEPERAPQAAVCDLMRKPSTLSNRAILQAGRVVQRGRPSIAGGRLSRTPSAQAQKPLAEEEEEQQTTWI